MFAMHDLLAEALELIERTPEPDSISTSHWGVTLSWIDIDPASAESVMSNLDLRYVLHPRGIVGTRDKSGLVRVAAYLEMDRDSAQRVAERMAKIGGAS